MSALDDDEGVLTGSCGPNPFSPKAMTPQTKASDASEMVTEIVSALRNECVLMNGEPSPNQLCEEAADLLEAQERELEAAEQHLLIRGNARCGKFIRKCGGFAAKKCGISASWLCWFDGSWPSDLRYRPRCRTHMLEWMNRKNAMSVSMRTLRGKVTPTKNSSNEYRYVLPTELHARTPDCERKKCKLVLVVNP